jgi:hypothetical protein
MGYLAGRKGRRRHSRIMGHFVEDASRPGGAEANTAEFREAAGDEIISEAQTVISRPLRPGAKLLSRPEMIDAFLRPYLGPLDYEVFGLIHLDSHHRLIAAVVRSTPARSIHEMSSNPCSNIGRPRSWPTTIIPPAQPTRARPTEWHPSHQGRARSD